VCQGCSPPRPVCRIAWRCQCRARAAALLGQYVILLGDANAKLGSRTSDAVGHHRPDAESAGSRAMRRALEELQLFAPAAFCEFADGGDGATWTDPAGGRHRIDYVAVPQLWRQRVLAACTLHGLETVASSPDHEPVAVELELPMQVRQPRPTTRTPCLDVERLAEQAVAACFAAAVAECQAVPWPRRPPCHCHRPHLPGP